MKETKSIEDYLIFKSKYEEISGLKLPLVYLETAGVYVFRKNDSIIGGFLLGQKIPLRTIEIFTSKEHLKSVETNFKTNKYCEVCCFWIDRKYRKKMFYNAKFWIQLAYAVKFQNKDFVLYGTNSKGLAKMYGYPKNSLLLHKDNVGNRDTFIFIARRKDFAGGVWEIVLSKILKRRRKQTLEIKEELQKTLMYEVSQ